MTRMILSAALVLGLSAGATRAQQIPSERARALLPADVYGDLAALAERMSASGVPAEPLYVKALEGVAKRVPPDRLMPALQAYAGRLGQAGQAFGPGAPAPLLVAGADAIQRGVSPEVLRGLPTDPPRSAMAVVVLADLVESGVPTDRALEVMRDVVRQRARDDRMLDVSARVRRLIREGLTPQEAVDRVRRNLQRARDGRPPVPPGSQPVIGDRVLDVDGR